MKLAGKRLWRTEDGRLVEDGNADARILAYAEGDQLAEADESLADQVEEIEGEWVYSDTAGTGPAVNADTGEITQPGDPLPEVDGTAYDVEAHALAKDGDPEPEPEPEPEPDPEPEPEKPVDETTAKPRRRATVKR